MVLLLGCLIADATWWMRRWSGNGKQQKELGFAALMETFNGNTNRYFFCQ
jgi:hypothetical protein